MTDQQARVVVNYSSDREGAERVAQTITGNGGEAIAVGADVSKAADVAGSPPFLPKQFGHGPSVKPPATRPIGDCTEIELNHSLHMNRSSRPRETHPLLQMSRSVSSCEATNALFESNFRLDDPIPRRTFRTSGSIHIRTLP